jgi:acetolactate synthase small subunit
MCIIFRISIVHKNRRFEVVKRINLAEFKREEAQQRITIGCAFRASNSDQEQESSSIQFSLTTEQLDKLFKLLESQNILPLYCKKFRA